MEMMERSSGANRILLHTCVTYCHTRGYPHDLPCLPVAWGTSQVCILN
jgi:hypothetical protein